MLLIWLVCALVATSAWDSVADESPHRTLWARGEYARACEALEEAIDAAEGGLTFDWVIDYIDLLFAVGRVVEAVDLAEEVASSYPLPSLHRRLVDMYRYSGRPQEAEDTLQRSRRLRRYLRRFNLDAGEEVALGRLMQRRGEEPQAVLEFFAKVARRNPDFAPAHTAAGEVALERRAWDVAAEQFGVALDKDPGSQPALAGLAQAYHHSGDPRFADVLARLESLNPHHPRGLLLRARRDLDLGETRAALARLDSVLAVKAVHLEALALKGAAHFLDDDEEAAAAARKQAVDFNPFNSTVFRLAGEVASRHYRFVEGLSFQRLALAADEDDIQARLLLALDLLRLGRDAEAQTELQRVFEADPYRVEAYNLLGIADSMAEFSVIEAGLFVLKMPALEAAVLGEEMLGLLREAAARYQKAYRVELEGPVALQVFDDHDEFMVRSVGLPGSAGHLGICFGKVITMDSPRARSPGAMDWRQVLWHEFVHVITLQKTGNRLPRWLSEGISVYEETRRDSAWGQRLDDSFAVVVEEGGLPAVADLAAYFTRPATAAHLMFGYFAAGEFVAAYVAAHGEEALVRALEGIGAGKKAVAALVGAAETSAGALDHLFGQHMRLRCAALEMAREGSPFRLALERGVAAERGGDIAAAAAAYGEAFGLYPEYDGADAPLRRLARLFKSGGKRREALRRLVEWDRLALDERVELAQDEGARGAARILAQAATVAPFNAALQEKWATALLESGGAAGIPLNRLLHLDPPRRDGHRLRLARFLARRDQKAAKAAVIALLEEKPHYRPAQELLLELVERGAGR